MRRERRAKRKDHTDFALLPFTVRPARSILALPIPIENSSDVLESDRMQSMYFHIHVLSSVIFTRCKSTWVSGTLSSGFRNRKSSYFDVWCGFPQAGSIS